MAYAWRTSPMEIERLTPSELMEYAEQWIRIREREQNGR